MLGFLAWTLATHQELQVHILASQSASRSSHSRFRWQQNCGLPAAPSFSLQKCIVDLGFSSLHTHTETHTHTRTRTHTHTHTETHRETHTETQTQRHTETHADTHTHTETHTDTHTDTHRDTQRHTETHRDTGTDTHTHKRKIVRARPHCLMPQVVTDGCCVFLRKIGRCKMHVMHLANLWRQPSQATGRIARVFVDRTIKDTGQQGVAVTRDSACTERFAQVVNKRP